MSVHEVEETESELERLRLELAILRTAKIRDDLTRFVNNSSLADLRVNDINRLHSNLHDLEVGSRKLIHKSPSQPHKKTESNQFSDPLLLLNPLPKAAPFSIESVADKFRSI